MFLLHINPLRTVWLNVKIQVPQVKPLGGDGEQESTKYSNKVPSNLLHSQSNIVFYISKSSLDMFLISCI